MAQILRNGLRRRPLGRRRTAALAAFPVRVYQNSAPFVPRIYHMGSARRPTEDTRGCWVVTVCLISPSDPRAKPGSSTSRAEESDQHRLRRAVRGSGGLPAGIPVCMRIKAGYGAGVAETENLSSLSSNASPLLSCSPAHFPKVEPSAQTEPAPPCNYYRLDS